jgi:hypothetical protein
LSLTVAVIVDVPFAVMEVGFARTAMFDEVGPGPGPGTAPASLLPPESLLHDTADMRINSSAPYIRVVLAIDKLVFIFPSCYKIQLR